MVSLISNYKNVEYDIKKITVDNKNDKVGIINILFNSGEELNFYFDLTKGLNEIDNFMVSEIEKTIRCRKLKKIKECLKKT